MADGLFTARPSPLLGNTEGLRLSTEAQFRELSADDQERKFIRWTVWAELPEKYQAGDMYYFAAGVVGLVEGIYYWNGSSWVFSGDYPTAFGSLYSNTTVSFNVAVTDTKLAPWTIAASQPVEVLQDITAGTLTVQRSGLYFAQAFVDLINPAPNLTWQIVFYRNGAEAPLTRVRLTAKDNGDGVNLQTVIVAGLNAGDVIDVRLACSSAQTISIISKFFTLVQQQ